MRLSTIIVGVVVSVFLLFFLTVFGFFAFVKLEGNEVGVVQDWGGVKNEVLLPGMHFYNNFIEDVHKYNIGTQKITFDDAKDNKDSEYPRILLDIGENGGQKAWVAISVNYHLATDKIVTLHKQGIGRSYEQVVLKREIVDVVNEIARPRTALEIYSGTGFVKFKTDVDRELKNNPVLKDRGLEIENTIIYKVYLDPLYEAEIAAKQIAQQQALRKKEETKAAEEEAKRIFALSQAEVEKARQGAEAQKIIQITAAEAAARQQVLQAEAEKQKRTLEAEGERDANLALAAGVLAVGGAEAKVAEMKTAALYAGESGERRARIETAQRQAEVFREIVNKISVLPERAFVQIGKTGGIIVPQADTDK